MSGKKQICSNWSLKVPIVSVIAASYNQAQHIHKAIMSVLAQSFADFELIITDDASTDDTPSIIELFSGDSRLKILNNSQRDGLASALSRSASISQGKYIACFNCNDLQERHRLETLVPYLESNASANSVFAQSSIINDNEEQVGKSTDDELTTDSNELLNQMFRGATPLNLYAGLVRRESFVDTDYLLPVYGRCYEQALLTNLLFDGGVQVIPDMVLRSRIDSDASSLAALNRKGFETYKILDLYLKRINSSAELLAIFPEVKDIGLPVDENFVEFHLALLALSCEGHGQKMFGLNLLHDLLNDSTMLKLLKTKCGFRYQDLFDFEDSADIFASNSTGLQSDYSGSDQRAEPDEQPLIIGSKPLKPIEGYPVNFQNIPPTWTPQFGILPREGPHPDHGIPFGFYWCNGPVCSVMLTCDRSGPHMLVIDCQNLLFDTLNLKVKLNNKEELASFDVHHTSGAKTVLLQHIVNLKRGKNEWVICSDQWNSESNRAFILRDIKILECFE
jgi:glycosyltransferase involved in cell wall biosynthesis